VPGNIRPYVSPAAEQILSNKGYALVDFPYPLDNRDETHTDPTFDDKNIYLVGGNKATSLAKGEYGFVPVGYKHTQYTLTITQKGEKQSPPSATEICGIQVSLVTRDRLLAYSAEKHSCLEYYSEQMAPPYTNPYGMLITKLVQAFPTCEQLQKLEENHP
jgi:hypothetical protein